MKSAWKWVLSFLGVFLVVYIVALPLFRFRGFGRGFGGPMMGLYGGGHGSWGHGFGLFGGGLMMLGMVLIPLAFVALIVIGAAALIRKGNNKDMVSQTCVRCGKPVQSDWMVCPYCGEKQDKTSVSEQDK